MKIIFNQLRFSITLIQFTAPVRLGDPEQTIVFDRQSHYWQEMVDFTNIFDKNMYEVNMTLRTFSKVDAFWQRTKLIVETNGSCLCHTIDDSLQ